MWSGAHGSYSDQTVQAGDRGLPPREETRNPSIVPVSRSVIHVPAEERLTDILCLWREGTWSSVDNGHDAVLAALWLVVLDHQEAVYAGLTPMPRLPRSRLTPPAEDET